MRISICSFVAFMALCTTVFAQNTAIIVEAESATLGSNLITGKSGDTTYVTVKTAVFGNSPRTATDVGSLSITFPQAGAYDLYARIYVNSDTVGSDSFFYGGGLGSKTLSYNYDWVVVSNLASSVGFSAADDVVNLENGSVTTKEWKWVHLSGYGTNSVVLSPPSWSLTQTLQFAGRGDSILIDKFAFARNGMAYTVNELEKGLEGTPITTETIPTGPEIAKGKSKFLGCVYSESDDQNKNFSDYWNEVVPGNGGKWGWVESSRDVMNWTDLDSAYNYAKDNGYPFCYHVLVWGSQQPTWIKTLSQSEQLEEIKEWFQAVADRYPDIDYLQVVNEPLHARPDDSGDYSGNYMDALGGTGTTGHDWIIEAFRLAKHYFPNTPLMINDYGIIGSNVSTAQYIAIIKDLQAEGLVDYIGIQCHAFETVYYDTKTLKTNLDALAATGLDIMVTEMDIDGLDDDVQLAEYQRIFSMLWKHPQVMGISLWGYRVGLWRTESGSFIVDNNGCERPSMKWLREYVESSTEWLGWPVTNGWANTGRWMGWVNVEKEPWAFAGRSWIYFAKETYCDAGCWGYILNSVSKGTETGENTWHGYAKTDKGWVDTGNWMGWVNVASAPKLWTDYGWVYMMEDTCTEAGAWAWFYK